MAPFTLLWVALAGGLGAIARFLVDGVVLRHNRTRVPLGTGVVNITGSFALGLIVGWATWRGAPHLLQPILGTGFMGGYTTFSAASVEVVRLAADRAPLGALVHAAGMLLASVGAAAMGLWLMSR